IASFHTWPDICSLALNATKRLLVQRGAETAMHGFEEFWTAFSRFEELQHAHGHTVEEILGSQRAKLDYDVARWLADGMPRNVSAYKAAKVRELEFRLSEDGYRGLADALEVWSAELKGLTKMMKRIRVD